MYVLRHDLPFERQMYTDLLRDSKSNPQQPSPTNQPIPALSRAEHPQINYWTQEDWNIRKAKVRQAGIITSESKDEVGALDFIESVDGIPVSMERIAAIRCSSHKLFVSLRMMYKKHKRGVPGSWGLMSHSDKLFYREKMKEQYPELGLCEADWKFEFVATDAYPGWYRNHGGGKAKVKQEPGAKQQSKTTTSSSGSPTPTPNDAPGHVSTASTTPGSGTPPVAPPLDLRTDPEFSATQVVDPLSGCEVPTVKFRTSGSLVTKQAG